MRTVLQSLIAALIIVSLKTGVTQAHHAMEYIEMESYTTPARGEKVFYLQYDYMVKDLDNPNLDRWEITPGLSYGLTDRLLVDIHTHVAKFGIDHIEDDYRDDYEPHGPSPFIEAVALSMQYRLTENQALDIALSGTWELPLSRAERLLGDDEYVYQGSLILSRDFGHHANVCLNLSGEIEGSETAWFWALGAKVPISADPHGIAAAIEILGDFDGDEWQILPGLYAPIGPNVMLKTGLEIGRERNGEDQWADTLRANVGLMYTF